MPPFEIPGALGRRRYVVPPGMGVGAQASPSSATVAIGPATGRRKTPIAAVAAVELGRGAERRAVRARIELEELAERPAGSIGDGVVHERERGERAGP